MCPYMQNNPSVTVFNYNESGFTDKKINPSECINFKGLPGVTWLDVKDVHDKASIEQISECYGFHQLVRESLLEPNKRAKIEDHGDYLFLALNAPSYSEESDEIITEPFDMIIGGNYVITFRQKGTSERILEPVLKRIKTENTRVRKSGPDYLAYRIIDAIVDNYFALLEWYGESVELVESEVFHRQEKDLLVHIQKLRREMLSIRASIWPLREVLNSLQRGESRLVKADTRLYMRDVYDHTVQIIETLETSRDMMSSLLEIYLSTINNKLNEVMKILTVISTIFIPLTFISSIYGMNFRYMPELGWKYAYPAVWGIIFLVVAGMLTYFKRKRWF